MSVLSHILIALQTVLLPNCDPIRREYTPHEFGNLPASGYTDCTYWMTVFCLSKENDWTPLFVFAFDCRYLR